MRAGELPAAPDQAPALEQLGEVRRVLGRLERSAGLPSGALRGREWVRGRRVGRLRRQAAAQLAARGLCQRQIRELLGEGPARSLAHAPTPAPLEEVCEQLEREARRPRDTLAELRAAVARSSCFYPLVVRLVSE